jgi:methyltransferase (TIGR00027 family)
MAPYLKESYIMSDRKASRTALGAAYMRAVHQLFDSQPLILDDPFALSLLAPTALQQISNPAYRYRTTKTRALRAHIVLRSRFAEDRLAAAFLRGISQYIILGAGFDTFALRQPSWAQTLNILEVDHPGTQAEKLSRLACCGLSLPQNAHFANIDFEHESLRDGLLRYHICLNKPAFFSWLGVTMYLNENAIDAVLLSVASFPAGSEIVLTFAQLSAPELNNSNNFPSLLASLVSSAGEPFLSFFEPDAIETKLRNSGFSKVEFLSSTEAETRYFRHRPNDLPVPRRTGIVCAIV